MKFRLKKSDDAIELERFLKAIEADEDYQKIRFMIKDGHINVNGEAEFARRRLLFVGDSVSFKDKYYKITTYKDNEPDDVIKKKIESLPAEQRPKEVVKIIHNKKPLSWSQKYDKDE